MLCHPTSIFLKSCLTRHLIRTILACTVLCLANFNCCEIAIGQSKSADEKSATDSISVSRLRLGLGGLGRVGCWIPIQLEASGFQSDSRVKVVVVASDARGDQCEDIVTSVTADNNGHVSAASVFMTGRLGGIITVRLLDVNDRVVWEHNVRSRAHKDFSIPTVQGEASAIQSDLRLLRHGPITFATVGIPDALAALANELAASKATREALAVMSVELISDLPVSRRGLDSIDFLILVDGYDLSAQQAQAVEQWVTSGGHLIVSCGSKLSQLLQSTVGDWLQPIFQIESSLIQSQDLSGLQNFVSGSSQLQTYRNPVPIMKLRSDQAWSVVDSINGPLMQRVSYGAGMISVVAVDLNQKPVNQWLSLPQLYEMLIFSHQLDTSATQSSRSGRISSSGVSDLATQLAAVSDAVPAENRWSTWSVMLLMVVFLFVIGPLDYLIVVRMLKKPHYTWLTFPLMIISACAIAVFWVGTRDAALVVRQVHLLDVAEPGRVQTLHVRSWNSISSADSGNMSLIAKPSPFAANKDTEAVHDAEMTLSWHGRPEDVYGGLYREGGVTLGRLLSHRNNDVEGQIPGFSSIPMLSDGSKAFLAESFVEMTTSKLVDAKFFVPASGLLEGEFTHHLASPIRDWSLVFGNRVYRPSPKASADDYVIEPGRPWSRENYSVSVSDLRQFLKGVRVTNTESQAKPLTTPRHVQIRSFYDTEGTDPLDILMMVSLFEVPGGETFAKLQNNALRRDDVSDGIHLNTVLVLGRLDTPLSETVVNGVTIAPTQSQTVVRLLLPVFRNGEDSRMAEPLAAVSAN